MSWTRLVCCLALLACACGVEPVDEPANDVAVDEAVDEAVAEPADAIAEPGSPLDDLRSAIAALAERPEHTSKFVRVQHVLVGVKGGRAPGAVRSEAEAEAHAADIFRRAQDGEPFRQLQIGSDDTGPGEYALQFQQRKQFAEDFGTVAWRLFPGEIGVCAYDPETSPFGYHVIMRIL